VTAWGKQFLGAEKLVSKSCVDLRGFRFLQSIKKPTYAGVWAFSF